MTKIILKDDFRVVPGLPERTVALARNIDDGIYDQQDADLGRKLTPLEVLERGDSDTDLPDWLRGTTPLQRLLMVYGVRTRDDHERGLPASTVGEFMDAGGGRGRVLFPLWMETVARAANAFQTNRFYMSTQTGDDNGALRPHAIATQISADAVRMSILPLLVGLQELSDGRPYLSFHMTHDATKSRMRRTTEGAPAAVYSLTGTDRTHRLIETKIELRVSYKALREWSLPVLQQHMTWINQQNAIDKEQVAYETHLNGDGGSATASNTNVSSLAGGVAGTVTYGNILEFLRLYETDGNYAPTVALGLSAVVAKFDTSTFGSGNFPTFGPLGIALLASQAARPEARLVPPMYAKSYATANKMLFSDAATLRMKYVPVLVERDRVIAEKFEQIVISEETGFDHLRDGGRRTLDVNN